MIRQHEPFRRTKSKRKRGGKPTKRAEEDEEEEGREGAEKERVERAALRSRTDT